MVLSFVGEEAAEQLMAILEEEDDVAELSLALVEFTAEAEALEPTSLAEALLQQPGLGS